HHWVDVVCEGRVHVMDGNGRKLFSYTVRGEGTSPRSASLSNDERAVAYQQAAHYAAAMAAEAITPRKVRESIELDDTAPAFDEAYAMINSERLADARAIWEAALQRHRDSAPLRFNLGAVCEAVGDVKAARAYFQSAVKADKKYAREFDLFLKRNDVGRVSARRRQDHADREAAGRRPRDRDGRRSARAQRTASHDPGLDGHRAEPRHLDHVDRAAVRVSRPLPQPARHARPRRFQRRHLPHPR